MDVVNPTAEPVRLHVRVDRRADGEGIFWAASRTPAPRTNTLDIELATMRPDVVLEPGRADDEPFQDVFRVHDNRIPRMPAPADVSIHITDRRFRDINSFKNNLL